MRLWPGQRARMCVGANGGGGGGKRPRPSDTDSFPSSDATSTASTSSPPRRQPKSKKNNEHRHHHKRKKQKRHPPSPPPPKHSQQPPGVVQNWSSLQCSENNTEQCGYDHAPLTRGRMRAQYPLPHGPLPLPSNHTPTRTHTVHILYTTGAPTTPVTTASPPATDPATTNPVPDATSAHQNSPHPYA